MTRALTPLLIAALCFAAPALGAPAWSVFKHDQKRTGRTSAIGPQTLNVKWTHQLNVFGIQSGMTIGSDGTIYTGSVHGVFYAFKPDGSIRWKVRLGKTQITAAPAIARDGTIYVTAEDGKLHAFTKHGAELWSYALHSYAGPSSSPVIGRDGTISEGHAEYPVGSAPAIAPDGTIYINTNNGVLLAYRADGTLAWKYKTPGIVMDVPSSPAVGKDGTIYFGGGGEYHGEGGYFYALHPDGSLKWSYFAGCDQTAPTIGGDGTIYFGSNSCGAIHALKPNGTDRWAYYNIFDYARTAPVIAADGTLYAGLLGGPGGPDQGGLIAFGP